MRVAQRSRSDDAAEENSDSKKPSVPSGGFDLSMSGPYAGATQVSYGGTSLAIPLSLGMREPEGKPTASPKKRRDSKVGEPSADLPRLPPNAVDDEGNILVTEHDILCGRGGVSSLDARGGRSVRVGSSA
jgi:hypothetical protein